MHPWRPHQYQCLSIDQSSMSTSTWWRHYQQLPQSYIHSLKTFNDFIRESEVLLYISFLKQVYSWAIHRLWHQLTLKLFDFFRHELSKPYRVDVFEKFVQDFESKLNQLRLVEMGVIVSKEIDSESNVIARMYLWLHRLIVYVPSKIQRRTSNSSPAS